MFDPLRHRLRHIGIYRFDADTLVICLWRAEERDAQTTFDLSRQKPPGTVFTYRRVFVQNH